MSEMDSLKKISIVAITRVRAKTVAAPAPAPEI